MYIKSQEQSMTMNDTNAKSSLFIDTCMVSMIVIIVQ